MENFALLSKLLPFENHCMFYSKGDNLKVLTLTSSFAFFSTFEDGLLFVPKEVVFDTKVMPLCMRNIELLPDLSNSSNTG